METQTNPIPSATNINSIINNNNNNNAGSDTSTALTIGHGNGRRRGQGEELVGPSSSIITQHQQQQQQQTQQQKQQNSKEIKQTSAQRKKILARNANASMEATTKTLREAMLDLADFMKGTKSDTLLLLLATALVTPLCRQIAMSPILGFLAAGMILGPNGLGLISGIHTTETLADLGIVFFLFEMGIELSFDRLLSMKRDVFGLGFSQFATTAMAIAAIGRLFGLPANALVVLGGGLALSSSAFVLQLLKDKQQLATRFGKASFGVLLFQDLAIVPLLVVTPVLAGGGGEGIAAALGSAVIKAGMALFSIALVGRIALNPLFKTVAASQSQEAFLGVILLTVLSMSFLTEGLGLSNTLGAFLAGVLLSETKYRYQIEADIAPFRAILLGLFFVTVGFEIDVHLISANLPQVAALVLGIVTIKAGIATLLALAFGLSLPTSQQTGLILSQGGEFAFVAFGLARNLGILNADNTKLLLTCVSLTMAVTPLLSDVGGKIAKRLEDCSDPIHYTGEDRDANEIKETDDFVVVIGYGKVGKMVCDILDRKLINYVGVEVDPNKAIQARNKGLPVFYGDIGRPEVAEAFGVGKAKAVISTISDRALATRALIQLRRQYPNMKIFSRAVDADHANRLQNTLDVIAMVPILPEDNFLLILPFAGAVLKSLGEPAGEVNAIIESKRKELLSAKGKTESEAEVVLAQFGIVEPPKVIPKTNVTAVTNLPPTTITTTTTTTTPVTTTGTTTTATAAASSSTASGGGVLDVYVEDLSADSGGGGATSISSSSSSDDDAFLDKKREDEQSAAIAIAAAAIVEEKKGKNPMVAEAIEANIAALKVVEIAPSSSSSSGDDDNAATTEESLSDMFDETVDGTTTSADIDE